LFNLSTEFFFHTTTGTHTHAHTHIYMHARTITVFIPQLFNMFKIIFVKCDTILNLDPHTLLPTPTVMHICTHSMHMHAHAHKYTHITHALLLLFLSHNYLICSNPFSQNAHFSYDTILNLALFNAVFFYPTVTYTYTHTHAYTYTNTPALKLLFLYHNYWIHSKSFREIHTLWYILNLDSLLDRVFFYTPTVTHNTHTCIYIHIHTRTKITILSHNYWIHSKSFREMHTLWCILNFECIRL